MCTCQLHDSCYSTVGEVSTNLHVQIFDSFKIHDNPDRMRAMSYFGDQIKAAREAAGLSQKEIGEHLGIGRENYNGVENGRRSLTDREKLKLLSEKINVPVETLQLWQKVDKFGIDFVKRAALLLPVDELKDICQEATRLKEQKESGE
jgi:transcriptional regulator with XRE-family HTH domain